MTTQKTSNVQAMGAVTPGTRLRQAREAANLSAEALADKLHISEAKLRALEQDQYEKIASDTFVRGYLRSYGKLVGLDGNELIACYNAYLGQLRETTEQVTQIAEHRNPEGRLPPWATPAAIVGGLILLWVLAVNLAEDEPAAKGPAPVSSQDQPPAEREAVPEEETLETPAEPKQEPIQQPAPATEEPAQVPVPQPAPSNTTVTELAVALESESAAAAADVIDHLTLSFTDECWVEVSDARGDVLFTDLQQAGDNLALDGEAPFKVILGNARAVMMALNGEAIEVQPEGTRKTLRLMVGQ